MAYLISNQLVLMLEIRWFFLRFLMVIMRVVLIALVGVFLLMIDLL
jgi:hypothetical protein